MTNEMKIPLARALACVERRGPDECWPSTNRPAKNGYVLARAYLHRVILTHTHVLLPQRCRPSMRDGAGPCGNPAHLAWGTRADNEADKVMHGRSSRGERQWQSKLTTRDVLEIRARCAAGETQSAIARAFGLNQGTVSQIANRKRWAWL